MAKTKIPKEASFLQRYKYVVVFIFSFLLYANTIPNEYNLDDSLVTTTDPQAPHRLTAKGISGIPDILSEPYYKDDQGYAYEYRPVVLIIYAIEHSLFGDNIHVSHFFNAMLYGLLCILLLLVLMTLFSEYNPVLPILATLLYAAHPIHTEVVASAKSRDEILALLFGLMSLLYLLRVNTRKDIIWFGLSVICFFIALLSKQTIVSFIPISAFCYIMVKRNLWVPIFFSVIGVIVYIPISYFSALQLFDFGVGAVVFVLIIYAVRYFSRSTFERTKEYLSDQEEVNNDVAFFQTFQISYRLSIIVSVLAILSSLLLNFFAIRYYLLPLTILFFLPFLVVPRGRNFSLILVVICSCCLAAFIPYQSLLSIMLIYVILTYSLTPYSFKIMVPVLIVVFTALTDIGMVGTGLLLLTAFGALAIYGKSRYLNILTKIILTIVVLADIIRPVVRAKGAYIHDQLSVTHLSLLKELLLASLLLTYGIRKYLWIVASVFIMILVAMYNPDPVGLNYESTAYAMSATNLPHIIERSRIERPISIVESVTGVKSSMSEKLGTSAQVFRKYLLLTVIPYPQSFYYGYKIIEKQSVFEPKNLLTMMCLMLLFLASILLIRKNIISSIGIMVYLLGISIYSDLLQVAPGMMADRFLFVPTLGFSILLAYGIIMLFKIDIHNKKYDLNPMTLPPVFRYSVLLLLGVYSVMTIMRNSEWKNHLTLFSADIGHLGESVQANNLYALQLMLYSMKEPDANLKRQMQEKAEVYFSKALQLYPEFGNAQYDLARTQNILGKNRDAEENFYKAGKLIPAFPTPWLSAGEMALKDNRPDDAKRYYSGGLTYCPDEPALYSQLSYTYFVKKQYDSAMVVIRQAMGKFPVNPDFPTNAGRVFIARENKDSALYYLNKALQLAPHNQDLENMIQKLDQKKGFATVNR